MKKILLYAVVGLQVIFLVGMSASYYLMDYFGEEIHLKTLPIDPQDIFYGDYVTLRYEIEEIPTQAWVGVVPSYNDRVYVLLENKAGVYKVIKASTEKLSPKNNQVRLNAKYEYQTDNIYYVDYGLDRYFIEDNTGKQYEQSGEMEVTVAIAPWGQKKIVSID